MLFRNYLSEQANATQEIRFMRILLAGLLMVILVVAGVVLKLVGNEKTVLVPPEIKRSFWVSGNAVSREYLADMAYWYAGLALNITPAVSTYQNSLFLKYEDRPCIFEEPVISQNEQYFHVSQLRSVENYTPLQ